MSLPHLEPTVSAARFSAALSCKPALPMAFYVVHSEMPSFTMPYPQSVQGDNPVWVSGNGKSSCQHFAHPWDSDSKAIHPAPQHVWGQNVYHEHVLRLFQPHAPLLGACCSQCQYLLEKRSAAGWEHPSANSRQRGAGCGVWLCLTSSSAVATTEEDDSDQAA